MKPCMDGNQTFHTSDDSVPNAMFISLAKSVASLTLKHLSESWLDMKAPGMLIGFTTHPRKGSKFTVMLSLMNQSMALATVILRILTTTSSQFPNTGQI